MLQTLGFIVAGVLAVILLSYTVQFLVKTKKLKEEQGLLRALPSFWAVFLGIIGEYLFTFAGVFVWVLLYQVGYVAGICGVFMMLFAIMGYKYFSRLKVTHRACYITSGIVVTIQMIFAEFCGIILGVLIKYPSATMLRALDGAWSSFIAGDVTAYFLTDILVGLVAALFTGIVYYQYEHKNIKVIKIKF